MADATVTVAQFETKKILAELAQEADILAEAIGRGNFVIKEFANQVLVVTHAGMNRDAKRKLIGDVKFDEVEPIGRAGLSCLEGGAVRLPS